tara:strand:- start:66 stop:716 length:651 start_codon:yes stop_codon:yes gene_type:complete
MSKPMPLTTLNVGLLVFGIFANSSLQIFCRPTLWAKIVIAVCFINTAFYPLMSKFKKILPLLSLINGISIFMFLYCVLFLNELAFFGVFLILFFGVGLLIFIPHFMLIQIFWNGFIRQSKLLKIYVLIGFFSCLVPCAYVSNEYKVAIDSLKELEKSGCQKLEKTMMTEYVMGAGFIYHTGFCLFDGWRPPIHERMLIIGRFFLMGHTQFRPVVIE